MIRETTLNTALFNHAFVGQGGADATAVGREAAPEQQRQEQADHAGDHQDDPNGVEVKARGGDVHGEGQDCQ
jgi:hypothetical protein